MTAAETQFWGDIQVTAPLTPIAVMRQAAAELSPLTRRLLEAEIESSEESGTMVHKFSIIAPSLDRYAAPLFDVRHGSMLVYPTTIWTHVELTENGREWIDDNTEEELRRTIQFILKSGAVKAIIYSLLAKINDQPK